MENAKIKVKVIGKGGSISAKFQLIGINSFKHHSSVRISRNRDKNTLQEGYNMSVKVTDFSNILDYSDISISDVIIDENSIDNFYCFERDKTYFSQNLTKGFIEKWFNFDCPKLYKYTVNKDKNTNWVGLSPFIFYDGLIECSFFDVYVSEDIEIEELQEIIKYSNKEGRMYEKLKNILDARELKEEDVEAAHSIVKKYDNDVQNIINDCKEKLEEKFNHRLNECYGLDCGFLYIYTKNKEYKNAKKILIDSPREINKYKDEIMRCLDVSIPLFAQSVNIQKEMFNFLKPYLEEKMKDEFYCITKLD